MAEELSGCRVLIVEDEYFLAHDLAAVLKAHGAQVFGPIGELSEAIEAVDRDGFDVAILDINLRDHATYRLADELLRQHIPFLFATGYSAEVIPERFRHIRRWEKPYEVPGIIRDVAVMCSGRAETTA